MHNSHRLSLLSATKAILCLCGCDNMNGKFLNSLATINLVGEMRREKKKRISEKNEEKHIHIDTDTDTDTPYPKCGEKTIRKYNADDYKMLKYKVISL